MSIINQTKSDDYPPKRPCHAKDKFWDFICLVRGGGAFRSSERSYLKQVPGGWLMRHLFSSGKKYTRSSIIFFPDIKGLWSDYKIELIWEDVLFEKNPNYKVIMQRLWVPEGWVIKDFLTTKSISRQEGITSLSLTYIQDPEHRWDITVMSDESF